MTDILQIDFGPEASIILHTDPTGDGPRIHIDVPEADTYTLDREQTTSLIGWLAEAIGTGRDTASDHDDGHTPSMDVVESRYVAYRIIHACNNGEPVDDDTIDTYRREFRRFIDRTRQEERNTNA